MAQRGVQGEYSGEQPELGYGRDHERARHLSDEHRDRMRKRVTLQFGVSLLRLCGMQLAEGPSKIQR